MHCAEVFVFWTNANNIFCNLYGIAVFRVESCNHSISIATLNHRHTKVVSFVHFVVSLIESVTFACTLLRQVLCVIGSASLFLVGTHINELNASQVELQSVRYAFNAVGVSQQNRLANTFLLCLYSSL